MNNKEFEENKESVVEEGKEMEKQMAKKNKHTSKVKSPLQERREQKDGSY